MHISSKFINNPPIITLLKITSICLILILLLTSLSKFNISPSQQIIIINPNIHLPSPHFRQLHTFSQISDNYQQQFWNSIEKDIYSVQNQKSVLGTQRQFSIKINMTEYKNHIKLNQLKTAGIWDKIQVGSPHDASNLTTILNFPTLKKNLYNSISYQLFTFPKTPQLTHPQTLLPIPSQPALKQDKQNFDMIFISNKIMSQYQTQLATSLLHSPSDPKLIQQQYRYYSTKYNIGSTKKQLPICIFAYGYNIFQSNTYIQFFTSLESLNYTNYHLIYVDDFSSQQAVISKLIYLQLTNLIMKNKITIIHTLQYLGILPSTYFFVNKYCQDNSIVITVDNHGKFVGKQALQIVNSVFYNQDIWFLWAKILQNKGNTSTSPTSSTYSQISPSQYRNHFNPLQLHKLRIFRKQLFSKIPLQSIIEYELNQQTSQAYPKFYQFGTDAFLTFPMMQMVGNPHFLYISTHLYTDNGPLQHKKQTKCQQQNQLLDQLKASLKTPLKQLQQLNQIYKYNPNSIKDANQLKQLKSKLAAFQECLGN